LSKQKDNTIVKAKRQHYGVDLVFWL
jgi:hypothetical protein